MSWAANQVRRFIEQTFRANVAGRQVSDDTPLFSSGIVDSFGVLHLIAFLEEMFRIEIDTVRHELADFDTVAKIVDLVAGLRDTPA